MAVTFIHTADWQLGKAFAFIPDDAKRARLQEERFTAIERIGRIARESGASFVLVAGDLFDSSRATKAVVSRACSVIGGIKLPVIAIPGNHDHGGAGSIWEQAYFLGERAELAPNLHILTAGAPYELDDAVILPCPLMRRHESTDPSGWIRAAMEVDSGFGDKARIVLAHGTVQAFGGGGDDGDSGGAVNLVDVATLESLPVDYIALGDWHGMKETGARTWYSGTPEPDRYPRGEDHRQGFVLRVGARRGLPPIVEGVRTAGMTWMNEAGSLDGDDGLDRLDVRLSELAGDRADRTLIHLDISGAIGLGSEARLAERIDAWSARLLDLRVRNSTTTAPTTEEIEELTRRVDDPLISRVAAALLEKSTDGLDDGDTASDALKLLYGLCHERRSR